VNGRTERGPDGGGGGSGTGVEVVAIDGPAGAGKSTLAQAVAEHLGMERLDTGAMYRAVAWAALSRHIDLADAEAVAALARDIVIDAGTRVVVDGEDATAAIRSSEVDAAVSAVAANPAVRTEMVARQRAWVAERGRGVVEGRDIGTVVLPAADVKIYLTAATETRARRRAEQRADGRSVEAVHDDLVRRDRLDSTRLASPLPSPEDVAADAKVIDSTGKSSQAVLEEVLACL
jgi:cytidylate kinase